MTQDVAAVRAYMLQCRSVTSSHKKSVMMLLPKTACHPGRGKDMRPVALLHVNEKLFSRAPTWPLEAMQRWVLHLPAPHSVAAGVHHDQDDAERAWGRPVRVSMKFNKKGMCVVALAIVGTFNNLMTSFLLAVLRRHGVGGDIVRLLQHMCEGATTRILVNGVLVLTEAVGIRGFQVTILPWHG